AVSAGSAVTGPQPLAARVVLIRPSTAPPWSPPNACAGAATVIPRSVAPAQKSESGPENGPENGPLRPSTTTPKAGSTTVPRPVTESLPNRCATHTFLSCFLSLLPTPAAEFSASRP